MSVDVFVPTSRPEDALVKQLHTITYVTADKERVQQAFCNGYDLEASPWFIPSEEDLAALNPYLGLSAASTWEACSFFKSGAGRNVQVRVIYLHDEAPMVRPEVDGRYLGGLSIGFPMNDMAEREKRMAEIGVHSTVGVMEMDFTGADGSTYTSAEILFMGPENIFLLGVRRPEIFASVGPVDSELGIGGAAYSARCVTDTEELVEFYQMALGFEARRDASFEVENPRALRLEEGATQRFIQLFAPGASTGYMVFLDHGAITKRSPAPELGPSSRGMAMWSFPTEHLDRVHENVKAAGGEVLQAPDIRVSPFLPETRTLIVKDPGGFPLEIFEV